tara:strand:+ start:5581 stop:5739 length:159 start_codon:yes stop_codon:yes gene_type:complete
MTIFSPKFAALSQSLKALVYKKNHKLQATKPDFGHFLWILLPKIRFIRPAGV